MPDLPPDMPLERLRAAVLANHPELADARFTVLTAGWDSVALDVDDRIIFKFPRHEQGAANLRREAALLEIIRPAVTLPVPNLQLLEQPILHSRHAKLAGGFLEPAVYADLPAADRERLGEALGRFYAELHAIDTARLRAAGALPVEPWLDAATISRKAWPLLPRHLQAWADTALSAWASLPPDPLGVTYGFFDGHGWNMAFDAELGRLNGIYDFGDSGFGPLHQEFIYSNLISPDLTERIVSVYERHTGHRLDRQRILLLSDIHRLWEIAQEAGDAQSVALMLEAAENWVAVRR